MNKIVNILKPTGMTSHDVVSRVRRILNMKKVGHTGTLDPDAAGVLPICLNKATKVSELILNKEKSYICELTLGASTDTYDSSGVITFEGDTSNITKEDIYKAFETQRGEIDQYPPIYSALKVNGQKMCDLARKGKADTVEIKARRVKIEKIEILNINENKILFLVKCSKGTYVRSICHDIGNYLKCGGHMSFLLRTSSGKFNLENSITLEELHDKYVKVYAPSISNAKDLNPIAFPQLARCSPIIHAIISKIIKLIINVIIYNYFYFSKFIIMNKISNYIVTYFTANS